MDGDMSAENTEQKQRGRPFVKGESGNPAGKPKGARHKTTLAMEALLEGQAESLTRKAVEMALDGDTTAMRLCFERILPARKDRPVAFEMPVVATAGDAVKAAGALLAAVASGDLTPSEAAELSRLLENFTRVLEASEFEERLSKLERKTNQ
jgi:Family of unknown function (DUF5681)